MQTTATMPKLKTEWNDKDFKTVQTAITAYFRRTFVTTMHNVDICTAMNFTHIANVLGLAYTSSSSFAMYSICNTEVYFDYAQKWDFQCFGLAEGGSGFVYALLHDKNENEIYFPIN